MKLRHIAEIALKILGIYLLMQGIASLPSLMAFFQMSSSFQDFGGGAPSAMRLQLRGMMVCFVILIPLYLGVSALLLFDAKRLSRLFVSSEVAETIAVSGVRKEPVLEIAMRLMGLYALITWLPQLTQTGIRSLMYMSWQIPSAPLMQRFYENGSLLITPAIGTLIGAYLLLRGGGLHRILCAIRPMHAGPAESSNGN